MDAAARVCPFCGQDPGPGVFCAVCGRNLAAVRRLPTRAEWDAQRSAGPDSAAPRAAPGRAADAVAGFLDAMRAAGNPGAAKVPLSQPGRLGQTRHTQGWVVRPVARDDSDEDQRRYEPGLFLTTEGRLRRLDSASRGLGQREGPRYHDTVGTELAEPPADPRLARDLARVLHDNGIDAAPPARPM